MKSVFQSIEDKERCQRMFEEMESELYTVGFHADVSIVHFKFHQEKNRLMKQCSSNRNTRLQKQA